MRYANLSGYYLPGDFEHASTAMSALANREADLSATPAAVTAVRLQSVAFTLPIFFYSYGYLLLEDGTIFFVRFFLEKMVDENFLLNLLPLSVYGLIAASTFAYALAHFCIDPRDGFMRNVYRAVAILLKETQATRRNKESKNHSSKLVLFFVQLPYSQILTVTFLWFAFLVGQYFCTALQSALITPRIRSYPFVSFDEMLNSIQDGWTYGWFEFGASTASVCARDECKTMKTLQKIRPHARFDLC